MLIHVPASHINDADSTPAWLAAKDPFCMSCALYHGDEPRKKLIKIDRIEAMSMHDDLLKTERETLGDTDKALRLFDQDDSGSGPVPFPG